MPFPRALTGYKEEILSDKDFVKNFTTNIKDETDIPTLVRLKSKLWKEVGKYSEYKNHEGQMKARKARHWANEVNKRINVLKKAQKK
jgi:hypothetical protein